MLLHVDVLFLMWLVIIRYPCASPFDVPKKWQKTARSIATISTLLTGYYRGILCVCP